MKDHFMEAFKKTMGHEGGDGNDPKDIGGHTYRGISKVYWPSWRGWKILEEYKESPSAVRKLVIDLAVEDFYRVNFWDRIQGDTVAEICPEVACELFDTGVNMDVPDAVRFLQVSLNRQNGRLQYPDLIVDGRLGEKTLQTLRRYLDYKPGPVSANAEILLNCMNGEQYIHYINNPQHEYFRGWFARV